MPNKTKLKGSPIRKEGKAGGAITPGHLVDYDVNGDIVVHASAGQNAVPTFAAEQDYIGGDIEKAYASSDQVAYNFYKQGEEVYAFLAASENVAKGSLLESAGDGSLQVHSPQAVDEGGTATYTVYNNAVVGRALEDVDNSAGGSAVRIKVEVL